MINLTFRFRRYSFGRVFYPPLVFCYLPHIVNSGSKIQPSNGCHRFVLLVLFSQVAWECFQYPIL